MTIQDICASFEIGGKYVSCKELSTGIINCTYHVQYVRDGEEKNYIVQRINKAVFKNPAKLMDNIICVTDYVRENIKKKNLSTKRFVLRAFLTKDKQKPFFIDEKGDYWRVYRYISNSRTYDVCDDMKVIESAGQAFGRFQNCLDGFDVKKLYVSIPNFHNTPERYKALRKVMKKDPYKRAKQVKNELEFLMQNEEKACQLQKYLDDGSIPLRVTHNDTKLNNVAIDATTGQALSVLDLDTVMPGAVAYDFGDSIRNVASTCTEEDPNIDNVHLNLDKYRAFCKGFIGEVKDTLTDFEKKTLNLGAFTITAELAVRFITDYIQGDTYFKTRYPGQNLDRARNQIKLAGEMLEYMDKMDEILFEFVK